MDAAAHLTKLAAAQRQLSAAIRMVLLGLDEVAVHTVIAAAFRILRDVKQKRGRSELSDSINRGMFFVARDLVNGRLKEMPTELDERTVGQIHALVDAIKVGKIKTAADVIVQKLDPKLENLFWKAYNGPSNFLKHADIDADSTLPLGRIDNQTVLLGAIASYIEIMGRPTPEMLAYSLFIFPENEIGLPVSTMKRLRSSRPEARKRLCLKLIPACAKLANIKSPLL